MKMKMEQAFHWSIWSASIVYSLFKFKRSCEYHPRYSPDDFTKGWSDFSSHTEHILKDNSDLEWSILTSTFKKFYLILLFQVICTQIILRINKSIILVFYSIFSLMCLAFIVGCPAVLLFVLYPALMFVVHRIGMKLICYLLTIFTLLFVHQPIFHIVKASLALKDSESFLFDVALAWLTIKSLSFAVDRIDAKVYGRWTSSDVLRIFAYCFYLPVFFTGPIMSYETFCQMQKASRPSPLKDFFLHFLHLLFCRISWFFVYELFLHFIYSSAVQFYPEQVKDYDSWALCGLGYALPMMFFLKYYIIYGTANGIGKLEGFDLPPPPKCISCIHLSSHLWRHFDRGLYLWLLKYLYNPVINSQWTILRKLVALVICFGFVCVWHGMDKSICLSSSINCLLVASEIVAKFILTTRIGKSYEKLPSAMKTRISAAVSTPHFLIMCLSCCFFLSNFEIGMLLAKRIFSGGCKHAVSFLTWLHRRSEEPAVTSVPSYWKPSKLSAVGKAEKFIKAKDLFKNDAQPLPPSDGSFLQKVKEKSKSEGRYDSVLTKYFKKFNEVEGLSIHHLLYEFFETNSSGTADEFLNFCTSKISDTVCNAAANETVEQAANALWFELRYARITASKAHEAAHCHTLEGCLVETVLGATSLKDTAAMARGRNLEKKVRKEVEKIKNVVIKKCGFKTDRNYPVMGASPDGISSEFVIEIKCPSSKKTVINYIKNGEITEKYKAQVHMQMFFCQKKKALFCIADVDFEKSKEVNILTIDYNEQYCSEILEKCTEFWKNAIFPLLKKSYN